ncbi:MAG: alpha-mannosidase [Herbinix sp.]|jgi:alpha-mannosidase|nr:alpha-mannosidase [Herbinix sp.]
MYSFEKNTLQRIDKFFERLVHKYHEKLGELSCTAYVTKEPVPFSDRLSGEKKELKMGDHWGDLFDCAWFHFTGKVPEGYGVDELVLLLDISGEGLCYDEVRGPITGITHGSVAWEYGSIVKHTVPLNLCEVKNGIIDLWVDGGCNDLFGNYVDSGDLKEAYIARTLPQMRAFYYDFYVLKDAIANFGEGSPRRACIIKTLNDAINVIYDFTEEEAVKACEILRKELEKVGGTPSLTVNFIGHSHIDLAWLWPIRETIRKGARTFATVNHMMDRYEDYRFGASQPQLFQWMKEYYPGLYEIIKKRVKEGKFELQGGMWVEADTNLAGGEALVRQILYGTKFWKDEFGVEVDNVWLPDVFGYTGALPQIIIKSGLKYFMTQKLSWNEHNNFPYHTFLWKGIDGTAVLTHMLPEETYNSQASPTTIRTVEKNYHEKGVCDQALVLFGIGDGGGGPGPYHLEKLKRIKNLEGFSPAVQRFAKDFFRDIDKNTQDYPQWSGELYFENHRGTYTTHARNKKYNRFMEQALRELEFALVLASKYSDREYPREELDLLWKEVLLYQFHDILPGSSIKRVYDECVPRYEAMYARVREMTKETYRAMTKGTVLVNSQAYTRSEYVKYNGEWFSVVIPAMGYANLKDKAIVNKDLSIESNVIENELLRVVFLEDGSIKSIYDKKNSKEVLPEGTIANQLSVYNDEDGNAWNIEVYYDEQAPKKFLLVSQRSYLDGVDAVMHQEYRYQDSTITQKVRLRQGCGYVEFDTHADWQEENKMLRTAFPVDVYTDEVTCDIQFGNLKRPTHKNTSWDKTQFEICAHKWIDLSRDDYGVALMNDCKYGHKVFDNVLDLALLRSSVSPGKEADRGEHDFRYALYPHAGNERYAKVEQVALSFNHPLEVYEGNANNNIPESYLSVDCDNVEIAAVKMAEDSDAVIVRMVETNGVRTCCTVKLPSTVKNVSICNLMERMETPVGVQDSKVTLELKPFEIVTIALEDAAIEG